ncbi:MAG: class I SAM-dependent methyltransferase [Promethearchaeota archaeon]
MRDNQNHYYSQSPDSEVKIFSITESLRKHLYIFKTITGVYSFKKIDLGTKIFINNMVIPTEPCLLLDLGCGYGPIGIVLAFESPKSNVYLIDINKRAIWCAKENIKFNILNYKNRVFALLGNYFEPIKHKNLKFDFIYMNPPIRQGKKDFFRLCKNIWDYLKPNGCFQFVIKKKMGAKSIFEYLNNYFSDKTIKILCKRSGYWVFIFF